MQEIKKWPVTALLAAANILVYLAVSFSGSTPDSSHMFQMGALYTPYVLRGEWYRIFTSMFLHFDIRHLANNMLVLVVLGMRLENLVGHVRFPLIYLLGGTGGSLVSMLLEQRTGDYALSAGASGATFALTGALLWLVLRGRGKAADLTANQVGIMAVLSLYLGFVNSGVNNAAHLGGLVSGFLVTMLLCPAGASKTGRRGENQWTGSRFS